MSRAQIVALLTGLMTMGSAWSVAPSLAGPGTIQAVTDFGQLPLSFEVNRGQAKSGIRYLARGPGYRVELSPAETRLHLDHPSPGADSLRIRLRGTKTPGAIRAEEPLAARSSYYQGSDPAGWIEQVPHFARIRRPQVYPGIDLLLYGNQRQLEYDFVVSPGSDPGKIDLEFGGARSLTVDRDGNLRIATARGIVLNHKPIVYQEIDGQRQPVDGHYRLQGGNRAGFTIARYDRTRPLIIDPVLSYATYLGGWDSDFICKVSVDNQGNPTLYGTTSSVTNPGSLNSVFVTKLSADGKALLQSTYLASQDLHTSCADMALDGNGDTYIAGWAGAGFPVTSGAYQASSAGDTFLAKLRGSDGSLIYSTYFGCPGASAGAGESLIVEGIAVDGLGQAFMVGGNSYCTHFPATPGAYRTEAGGDKDVFVAKFNRTGSGLVYATLLGAAGENFAAAIAVDAAGRAHIVGNTRGDFPVTPSALQPNYAGGNRGDGFVARLSSSGSTLEYSTFLGGSSDDGVSSIAIGPDGAVHLAGYAGAGFPTTPGAFRRTFGGGTVFWGAEPTDGFVAKFSPDFQLLYATFLGGNGNDGVGAIAVGTDGTVVAAGGTESTDFPTTPDAHQSRLVASRGLDGFVARLSPNGADLIYSSLVGSTIGSTTSSVTIDQAGSTYVAGYTYGALPATAGTYQASPQGKEDGYLLKLVPGMRGVACPEPGLWAVSAELNGQPGRGLSLEAQGDTLVATVYAYETSGKATFYQAAGPWDRIGFTATLNRYEGGTSLSGPWKSAQPGTPAGQISFQFSSTGVGTVFFPGEAPKAMRKFNWSNQPTGGIVPVNGLWAVDAELDGKPGRGFTLEVQGNTLVMTLYAYETDGRPVFYQTAGPLTSNRYSGSLVTYEGGASIGGYWKPARAAGSPGTVSIEFSDRQHGTITLPGESPKAISKFDWGPACQ